MEVCLPVRGAVTPTGNITAREMPGGPAALATGTGAYCEFPKVLEIYDRAFEWIKQQGAEPAAPRANTGPAPTAGKATPCGSSGRIAKRRKRHQRPSTTAAVAGRVR